MSEQVKVRHPDLKSSKDDESPPEKLVSRDAFDRVWSKLGWQQVEEGANNASVSATPPPSTRKPTDNSPS